jgi:hypothetical protein
MNKERYWEADCVQAIAADLIPENHPHLKPANIAYLFQDKARKRGDFVILGSARKAREIDKKLHGYDFIVCIAHDTWEELTVQEHIKLVDHELCHCSYVVDKKGNLTWVTIDHDVKDFKAIIERYGVTDYIPTEMREIVEEKKNVEN